MGWSPMGVFGREKPKRVVVKVYPSYGLLGLVNPIMYTLIIGTLGMRNRLRSGAQELDDDAVAMAVKGYRIVSSEQYTGPLLGIPYYRVTYELVNPPR